MILLDNWREVVKKAWSFRLNVLAALFSAAELILPLYVDAFPRGLFAGLTFTTVIGSNLSRVVAQKNMGDMRNE